MFEFAAVLPTELFAVLPEIFVPPVRLYAAFLCAPALLLLPCAEPLPALPVKLITVLDIIAAVTSPLPAPKGSPVKAGLSPILLNRLSAFLAVLAIHTISRHQGIIIYPVGMVESAEIISFKKSTFKTIIAVIEA